MEPGSQVSEPPERTSQKLANIIGTIIAFLTLAFPLFAISYFSSASNEIWQSPTYLLMKSRE